jgi:hypothetical protein
MTAPHGKGANPDEPRRKSAGDPETAGAVLVDPK